MKVKIAKILHRIAAYLEKTTPRVGDMTRHNSLQGERVEIEVDDTYEAAFYMTMGCELVSVRKRTVAENKVNKLGYREQWYSTLKGVQKSAIEVWKNGKPRANVKHIALNRRKIKRIARTL